MARCVPIPIDQAIESVGASIGCFVYDYQTLIGSILALIAAFIALKPVWTQLKLTALQTNIAHHETLKSLLAKAEERRSLVERTLVPLGNRVSAETFDDGECEAVDLQPDLAFSIEQEISSALSKCEAGLFIDETPKMEELKNALFASYRHLMETLSYVHFPVSTDQVGEDYSIPDEEWQEFLQRAVDAQVELPKASAAANRAYAALRVEQNQWIEKLRKRIAKLEIAIATSG